MSRPIIEIGQVTYATASNLVTIPVSAYRIRGTVDPTPNADNPTLTITGFSQSITLDLDDNGAYLAADGLSPRSVTFSADLETSTASTSDTTTYVPATVLVEFEGSATNGDVFTFSTTEETLIDHTFTEDIATASLIVDDILSGFSTTKGFTASVVGSTLKISAPFGAYYNGLDLNIDKTSTSLTASVVGGGPIAATYGEFSGGQTQYNLSLNAPDYFGFSDDITFSFTIGTYAAGADS